MSLHEELSTEATVDSVVQYVKTAVDADHAGALLIGPKHQIETVAASDDLVHEIGALQARLREGPDVTVFDGQAVTIADTCDEKRWPAWARALAEFGVRSVVSVRLSARDRVYGSITVYARRPNAFDEEDRAVVLALARHGAIAVSSSVKEHDLAAAIDSRNVIGQAQGMLMQRFTLTDEQAFAVLLRYSQHNNLKLRVVAQQVVDERDSFGES